MRYKAKCESCKQGGKLLADTLCTYVLDDGETVRIERTFAWCSECSEVTWVEEISSLEELSRERAALDHPNNETTAYIQSLVSRYNTFDAILQRMKRDLELRIKWRELRQSEPRCLSCGSMEILPSIRGETRSGNDKWELPCVSCNGIIRVVQEPVLCLDRGWIHYTPEGLVRDSFIMSPMKSGVRADVRI